ncbi:hypothetical protein E1266_06155 [Actinomadura sp. 7K534]|nr:hypothetical protein E1266_06155 [Actinomadura sp. 7K534]
MAGHGRASLSVIGRPTSTGRAPAAGYRHTPAGWHKRPTGPSPTLAHRALPPQDAFHLPIGRPVRHRIYRDAAHRSRLVLPFTKPTAAENPFSGGAA